MSSSSYSPRWKASSVILMNFSFHSSSSPYCSSHYLVESCTSQCISNTLPSRPASSLSKCIWYSSKFVSISISVSSSAFAVLIRSRQLGIPYLSSDRCKTDKQQGMLLELEPPAWKERSHMGMVVDPSAVWLNEAWKPGGSSEA
jgi:hypothetical protein